MAAHGELDRVGDHVAAETSDDFMPWWPMAMPSVTVIVVNSRGVPLPRSSTPTFDRLRLAATA